MVIDEATPAHLGLASGLAYLPLLPIDLLKFRAIVWS